MLKPSVTDAIMVSPARGRLTSTSIPAHSPHATSTARRAAQRPTAAIARLRRVVRAAGPPSGYSALLGLGELQVLSGSVRGCEPGKQSAV